MSRPSGVGMVRSASGAPAAAWSRMIAAGDVVVFLGAEERGQGDEIGPDDSGPIDE